MFFYYSSVNWLPFFFENFISIYLFDLLTYIDKLCMKLVKVTFLCQLCQVCNILRVVINWDRFISTICWDETNSHLWGFKFGFAWLACEMERIQWWTTFRSKLYFQVFRIVSSDFVEKTYLFILGFLYSDAERPTCYRQE